MSIGLLYLELNIVLFRVLKEAASVASVVSMLRHRGHDCMTSPRARAGSCARLFCCGLPCLKLAARCLVELQTSPLNMLLVFDVPLAESSPLSFHIVVENAR